VEESWITLRWNDKQYLINRKMDLIKVAEEAFATGKQFPEFKAGDTIKVSKEKDSEKLKFDIVSAE